MLFDNFAKIIFLLYIFWAFSPACHANSIRLRGTSPQLEIQRSELSAPKWQTSTASELSAIITNTGYYKITVEVNSLNPSKWQGRSLKLELDQQADWLAESFLATFHWINLVDDGRLLPNAETLVSNLETGTHPYIPLKYECWANKNAVPGITQLTVTFTLIKQ